MSNEESATQPGVYYVGTLVTVRHTQKNGFENGDIILIRQGSVETDRIAFKPGSDVHAAAEAIPPGSQVIVEVIPARRAVSRAGQTYVRQPWALAIEAA